MLLVDNDEPELLENRMLLDKSMRSDNDLDLPRSNLFQQLLFLRFLDAPPHDGDSIIQWSKDSLRIEKVLLGENLRRRHQRSLISV